MSNTKKHKLKGKFNNGLLEEIPIELENFFEISIKRLIRELKQ